jgi:hypothetical protein
MMGEKKKYRVQSETTTNTYVYCWNAAHRSLEKARENKQGALYFRMMAGVFAAFTVEGYLNHLGQERVGVWNNLERKLGPQEKLLLLRDMLHLSVDISSRPFQTLHHMMRLRDALAHGKTLTMKIDCVIDNPIDEEARYPQPNWKKLCSIDSVERMVEDAEQIIRHLCAELKLKRDPFECSGSGSSKIQEIKIEEEIDVA